MKIRITIMTENDKHFPDDVSDQRIEAATKVGWMALLNMLKDDGESVSVEKCELIER
jgi:hypothetical protein